MKDVVCGMDKISNANITEHPTTGNGYFSVRSPEAFRKITAILKRR
jgi:hypothetical protein